MFGKYGIDFGPEAHKGFSDREWKLACEFFDLMLHLPLTEDEDEWDSFFDWALSEVFDVDENTDHEVAFAEAEDALEWLRGLFEEDPEQNEIPFDPYLKIQRTSETLKRSSVYRDENGNLHCWNISAYQIPSISLTEGNLRDRLYRHRPALKALRICCGSWSGSQHKIFLLRWGRTHDKREKLC